MIYVEVARFRLKEGASKDDFLKAEDAVQQVMGKRPGFVSRELGLAADGYWFMDLRFRSKAEMDQWMLDLKQEPSMKTYGSMIDFASMRMEFYEKLKP